MGRRGSWSTLVQRLRRTNRSQRTRGRLIGNATHAEHQGAIFDRQGRGQLNIIAWEGYTQPQWVKPFEKTTGCVVNVKYAGSSSEMVSLMANGGGHQWDLVSASGDADLRLIYGGDVKPSTSS